VKQPRSKEKASSRVTVATYKSASAAARAREALGEAGIEASVRAASKGERGGSEVFQLQVAEENRTAAIEIVGSLTRPTG